MGTNLASQAVLTSAQRSMKHRVKEVLEELRQEQRDREKQLREGVIV